MLAVTCLCYFFSLFYVFIYPQKRSQYLANVMSSDNFAKRLNPHCVRMLVCFVDQNSLIKGVSADDQLFKLFCTLSGDSEGIIVLSIFHYASLICSLCTTDSSNADLRVALVHMIAIVLGCKPQSSHLWYNMFTPDELVDTFLPGFMVRLFILVVLQSI